MNHTKSFIILLLLFLSNSGVSGQNSLELQIKDKVEKYCPVPQQENKQHIFQNILLKLPASTIPDAVEVIDLVLPQICLMDYPSWLIDRTYNLAIYAIHEGHLKKTTVRHLTDIMPAISLGKTDYLSYGHLMENLLNAGVKKEFIFDLMHSAIEQSYGTAGAEALAYYYALGLIDKKSHVDAMQNALGESKLLKMQNDRIFILKKLFGDNKNEEVSKKERTSDADKEKSELEAKYEKFWSGMKNKINLREKFEKKESTFSKDKIIVFLANQIGTQYAYRSNKNYGMDVTGLISIITNTSVDLLPYQRDSYCNAETILSPATLKTGDVLLLTPDSGSKEITALGIYLDNNEFIYPTISSGLNKASLDEAYYKKRLVKGCRIIK